MRLRFLFDPGSGACFWSADPAAEAHFGDYPVALDRLGLPPALTARGEALIARYDTCLDWNDPGGPSPWPEAEWTAFRQDAAAFLSDVQSALPDIAFEDARN